MTTRVEVSGGAAGSGRTTWRKAARALPAAGLAVLIAVGLGGTPSQAQGPIDCTTVPSSGVVIAGDLLVPAGSVCSLTSATVTGAVDVQAGADLFLDRTTVGGSLTVRDNSYADLTSSTIGSGTFLIKAFGVSTVTSTFAGGVDISGAVFFFSQHSRHTGTLISRDGWTFIESGQVSGGLVSSGDEATDLVDTTVAGGVSVEKALDGAIICRSVVAGGASISSSGGVIQIGGDQPLPMCGENMIAGGLTLTGNQATDIQVSSNLITGGLRCVDNVPVPSGSDNLVFGPVTGQCVAVAEAKAGGRAVAATPQERREGILALIAERTAKTS